MSQQQQQKPPATKSVSFNPNVNIQTLLPATSPFATSTPQSAEQNQGKVESFEFRAPAPQVPSTSTIAAGQTSELAKPTGGSTSGAVASSTIQPVFQSQNTNAASSTKTAAIPQTRLQKQMTYRQLQNRLNKYFVDLQDHEQNFQEKVKYAKDMDKTMNSNGAKVIGLQTMVDSLKKDQDRVERELKFLREQQSEMERLLKQIESTVRIVPEELDPERLELYNMAARVDQELIGLGDDLKTVIDHINESNAFKGTISENNPMAQMMKIMNEHTKALLWVEEKCNDLKNTLPQVNEQHAQLQRDYKAKHFGNQE